MIEKRKKRPLITLTSDFGVQSQDVSMMEATALSISPDATILHLMHGLPCFDISSGARIMETILYLPVGYHVCVVDPGVGTSRRGIIIKTRRGDYLIGPDNGVLMPATRFLGFEKVVEITNRKYMRRPVSPVFHGRDVFAPAAAWLSRGIPFEEFGKELKKEDLTNAPYEEARKDKGMIEAQVIYINKFGSLTLNISHSFWDRFTKENNIKLGDELEIKLKDEAIKAMYGRTFGDVGKGEVVLFKDDYVRLEIATNQGRFIDKHNVKVNDRVWIEKG